MRIRIHTGSLWEGGRERKGKKYPIEKQQDRWTNKIIGPNRANLLKKKKSKWIDDKNFENLFKTLDELEGIVSQNRFLCGSEFTEADVRLFVTLIRFDAVYYVHFKCNKHLIRFGYPNLFEYIKEIYQMPGIKETVSFSHIKNHYYTSHPHINPTRIVPRGPGDLGASLEQKVHPRPVGVHGSHSTSSQ